MARKWLIQAAGRIPIAPGFSSQCLPAACVHPAALSRDNALGAGGDPSREQGSAKAV